LIHPSLIIGGSGCVVKQKRLTFLAERLGDFTKGEETSTYIVELKINGQTIDSKLVTLGGGQSETVSFTLTEAEPGQYEVTVSGLSGSFTVVKPGNWWIFIIIAAAVIILGGLGWRFRKRSQVQVLYRPPLPTLNRAAGCLASPQ